MAKLSDIVTYCDQRVRRSEIADFRGAYNGLQIANNGEVSKVGAAVDAGLVPFEKAAAAGVDFLIVHHGMFWNPTLPIVGSRYDKIKLLMENNLAVYGSHLPLDHHPEIGNNAILAKKLDLEVCDTFLNYEGNDIGIVVKAKTNLASLKQSLKALFPNGITSIEYGSDSPEKIAILTGSGSSAISELPKIGVDTLITGELKQNNFNEAQEHGLNLLACGHYATETFGVCALAQEVADKFSVPWEFIQTECPL